LRVLVIEDDALIAFDLTSTLNDAGHTTVGPAATSEQAFKLASANKPDVAFVDIRLRDGATGTQIARELQTRYRIPCVFVSSSAEDAHAARDAAVALIIKPAGSDTVLAALDVIAALLRGEQPKRIPPGMLMFRTHL
jgi:CheY-like chemotaxis protein